MRKQNALGKQLLPLLSLPILLFSTYPASADITSKHGHITVRFNKGVAYFTAHWPEKEHVNGPGFTATWEYDNSVGHQLSIPINLLPPSICVDLVCGCTIPIHSHDCIDIPSCSSYNDNIEIYLHNVTCNGKQDGYIEVEANGDGAPYTFQWSNGSASGSINHLSPGEYTVTVSNELGCEKEKHATIFEPDPLNTSWFSFETTPASCYGGNDGTAKIISLDPDHQYNYSWPGVSNHDNTTGLSAGTHMVTVSLPGVGCSTISCQVSQPDKTEIAYTITSDFNGAQIRCHGESNGTAGFSFTGGTPVYNAEIEGQFFPNISAGQPMNLQDLNNGSHTITVTDNNGCVSKHELTIKEPDTISPRLQFPEINGINIPCKGEKSGYLIANPSGGTGAFSYEWSTVDKKILGTENSINYLKAGTYIVTITDQNGCTVTETKKLTEPEKKIKTAYKPTIKTPLFIFGKVVVSGGVPGYHIDGKRKKQFPVFSFRPYKYYVFNIQDDAGCEMDKKITILKPENSGRFIVQEQGSYKPECRDFIMRIFYLECPDWAKTKK